MRYIAVDLCDNQLTIRRRRSGIPPYLRPLGDPLFLHVKYAALVIYKRLSSGRHYDLPERRERQSSGPTSRLKESPCVGQKGARACVDWRIAASSLLKFAL